MNQRSYSRKMGVGLTRGMRFNDFVVGPSNSSALSAARAVANNPAGLDGPLILCGQAGTGKTHLLNAIGNHVIAIEPETHVRCISAGSFSRELAEAAEQRTVREYVDSLVENDMLLIDDMHLVEDREWALSRLLSVIRQLEHKRGVVVITWCAANPRRIPTAEPLKHLFRFSSLCYLWPADGRTKTRIIQKELEDTGLSMPARMVSLLALADTGDIRELKGIVRNIVARAHLCGESVNRALVEGVLAKLADKHSGRSSRI